MECQASDSKKLFKVFDASKRKRVRKRRDGQEVKSGASEGSSGQGNVCCVMSAKASLQDVPSPHNDGFHDSKTITRTGRDTLDEDDLQDLAIGKIIGESKATGMFNGATAAAGETREMGEMVPNGGPITRLKPGSRLLLDSSPALSRSPDAVPRGSRSPRRHHRRTTRDGISLALKAGLVSTPSSLTPPQTGDVANDSVPQDHDSFIYAFLEEAIKRDKKKHRHERKCEEQAAREREASPGERRRRRRRDHSPREQDKNKRAEAPAPAIDQTVLLQTFAKLCASLNRPAETPKLQYTHSHKSLQCEVAQVCQDVDQRAVKLRSNTNSREHLPRPRSPEPLYRRSHENVSVCRSHIQTDYKDKQNCGGPYDKNNARYTSKLDVTRSRMRNVEDERYRDYVPRAAPTKSFLDHSYRMQGDLRDYRDFDDGRNPVRGRQYDEDKRRYYDQKTSRSYDVQREGYADDDRVRRTTRSEIHKDRRYDDRRYDDRDRDRRYEEIAQRDRYYDDKPATRERPYSVSCKERRCKKNQDRFERGSIVSRDDDYKDKDRYSERERDSGLSVADGENSTVSGRSNYLRVVKQEISEQREAMDKMMKLWKELMRCFKGVSQTQGPEKAAHECAANNVQESAATQLRLWRECMRRYETVARDVGDTDARLMEEINKQRSEMSEMASMWQECLQRYREMSTDFNNLKQKLASSQSPTRAPAPAACAEGEGAPPAPFLPPTYPPPMAGMAGYGGGGSPLRSRASVPPAWWWAEHAPPPRRRSSPDSRGSRDRDRERERRHRHKDRDRDDSKYKEKSKPSGARSEHRHRKR